jgi:hypothetical protein
MIESSQALHTKTATSVLPAAPTTETVQSK